MYERVLVPLDGSELSEQVLPHVEELAEKLGSTLVLIRVNPPLTTSSAAASPPQDPTRVQRFEEQAAQTQLERVAERLRAKAYTVETELPTGRPADQIVEYARAGRIDLIAMTTHGTGGLGRLLFGSVATHVLERAPCPVLLVRVSESLSRRAGLENVVLA